MPFESGQARAWVSAAMALTALQGCGGGSDSGTAAAAAPAPAAVALSCDDSMPSLNNRSNPAVLDYLKLVGDGDAPSMTRFEGYVHARVLVEGLRHTGRDLSTDNLIRALESAGEISFGKFASHYSTQSHNGSNYVELAIVDERGRLRY